VSAVAGSTLRGRTPSATATSAPPRRWSHPQTRSRFASYVTSRRSGNTRTLGTHSSLEEHAHPTVLGDTCGRVRCALGTYTPSRRTRARGLPPAPSRHHAWPSGRQPARLASAPGHPSGQLRLRPELAIDCVSFSTRLQVHGAGVVRTSGFRNRRNRAFGGDRLERDSPGRGRGDYERRGTSASRTARAETVGARRQASLDPHPHERRVGPTDPLVGGPPPRRCFADCRGVV
jgi:hypothetical protein